MTHDSALMRIIAIILIGGACFIASVLVLALTEERQNRFEEAREEIASKWGTQQVVAGPILVFTGGDEERVLPEALRIESRLEPEVRSRGIFESVVYTGSIKVSGEFLREAVLAAAKGRSSATFSLPITDTRGVEKQFTLRWIDRDIPFIQGPGVAFDTSSGISAVVSLGAAPDRIPFSFDLVLKGSEGISFAPVGKETVLVLSSPWASPKFTGSFLPAEREITTEGFRAKWRVSSFGRSYPPSWSGFTVAPQKIIDSAMGVDLHQEIDTYDMVFRSVKYAILFIIITFTVFFLFDILGKARIHPIQYLLIGSSLALFYVLLLSLAEQIGFFPAYSVATALIVILVTWYSAFVLGSSQRAIPIAAMLMLLYGYLYFVLRLEDYALLVGSLLLFAVLAATMYLTRNIDWFLLGKK